MTTIRKYYDMIPEGSGGQLLTKEEVAFDEISTSLSQAIDKLIQQGKYWKERCLAAEEIISISGVVDCAGYEHWEQLKNKLP